MPTATAFAAWKTGAWADRAASRDLYDLHLLANLDAINNAAADLYRRLGPTNKPPGADLFTHAPHEETWRRELAGQTRLHITAADALHQVRTTWRDATSQLLSGPGW